MIDEYGYHLFGNLDEYGYFVGVQEAPAALPCKVWNGSTWAEPTAVKVWNGSAWVNAVAVKYWNGTGWT